MFALTAAVFLPLTLEAVVAEKNEYQLQSLFVLMGLNLRQTVMGDLVKTLCISLVVQLFILIPTSLVILPASSFSLLLVCFLLFGVAA